MEGHYGNLFLDRWRDCDPVNVRNTWAAELAGFAAQPEAIAKALWSLSECKFPPTLPEFLAMCRAAAAAMHTPAATLLLDAPAPDPVRVAEAIAGANAAMDAQLSGHNFRGWAMDIRRRYLTGERLLLIQINNASEALGEKWIGGQCSVVA